MAYEAHKWKIGEEITSEKLNHIEKGIEAGGDIQTNITNPQDGQTLKYDAASGKWVNGEGGGSAAPLVANLDSNSFTLDKTWKEVKDAFPNVIIKTVPEGYEALLNVISVENQNGNYIVLAATWSENLTPIELITDSETGYPKINGN